MTAQPLFPIAALASLAGAFFISPAYAENLCAGRAEIINHLARQFSEIPNAIATVNEREVIEVLVSPEHGSWTMIVSRSDGTSCVLAAGEDWQRLPPVPRGEET